MFAAEIRHQDSGCQFHSTTSKVLYILFVLMNYFPIMDGYARQSPNLCLWFTNHTSNPIKFPNTFPKMFTITPWFYVLSHMLCPKFNSHIYIYIQTEKVHNKIMLLFLSYNWGSKEVLPLIEWGRPPPPNKCSKRNLIMSQWMYYGSLSKKKKKVMSPPMNNN